MTARGKEYAKGMRAYRARDYKTAYRILKTLADEGHPRAQVAIGSIYQLGLGGMAIDEDEAMRVRIGFGERKRIGVEQFRIDRGITRRSRNRDAVVFQGSAARVSSFPGVFSVRAEKIDLMRA